MAAIINNEGIPYSRSNAGTSQSLFNKKLGYKQLPALNGRRNIVDFNYGEFIFYGRMNMLNIPVVLRDPRNLMRFKRSIDPTTPLSALSFVVRVFNEMALEFDKAMASTQISSNQKYLSNLKVYRAYESPWLKYQEYKSAYFRQLSKKFHQLPQEQKFRDMKQFLNYLTQYLKGPATTVPFTYSSFIKSRFCSVMSTGLALEIADIDYSNDQEKIRHFIHSDNWAYYLNACNSYGFMIDKQYPFRLVADINSTVMKNLARAQVRGGGYSLFDTAYVGAVKIYLQNILQDLIELYNLSTDEYYVETTMCPNGILKRRLKRTPRYTMRTIFEAIDVSDILVFYMTTRINEQKPQMDIYDRQNLIKDCLSLYHEGDLSLGLMVFETIVSSTLDKMGSFAYYKEYLRELLAEAERRGTLEDLVIGPAPHATLAGGGY